MNILKSGHRTRLYQSMNSIGDDCNELKKQYDACFNNWFSERFLKGETDDSVCAPIFKVYQECVKRAMREQKIELREIETDYSTGTEYDNNNTQSGSKNQSGQSKS
ncbi:TP53-regulated inhibitor of apoptosis 1-like [Drosophila novamexicana]|uniref:TP53-regulated inhibitor of apoptosis 1-like n=1 Tax=Drosophila novamexicana TaxID=47314 RepID=UPI0011E5BEA0|nr:TP53-regulated inhibitor of apoptosis 1-like [Drosophila novamexicana]